MLTFSPKRLNFEKIIFKLLTNLFLDDILLSQFNKNFCPKTASGTFHKPKLVLAEEKNMRKLTSCALFGHWRFCFIAHTKFIKRRES